LIKQEKFLDKKECEDALDALNKYRDLFIPRRNNLFYTFGPASYLDANQLDLTDYKKLAEEYKIIFWSYDFKWLYGRLLQRLTEIFGPCEYSKEFAWPGFHIFLNSKSTQGRQATIHRDIQYKHLFPNAFKAKIKLSELHEEEIIPPELFTFTIPIYLPAGGTGLKLYEHGTSSASVYFPYQLGDLYYFRGDDLVHQIAGFNTQDEEERRVTIQGHGILHKNGKWEVYW
jgi:hypothetical protein